MGGAAIRNLSFWTALSPPCASSDSTSTSLIEEFHYPRLGPGQMWERFARSPRSSASRPARPPLTRIAHDETGVHAIEVTSPNGASEVVPVEGVVWSIPLSELVLSLDPLPPDAVVEAARRLRYRDSSSSA